MSVDKSVAVSLFVLVGVYIVSMVLMEHDEAWGFVVNFAFAIGAGAWIWKDAKRIELNRYKVWLGNSHVRATILTVLFPYVYLPCYAANRAVILSGHGELMEVDGKEQPTTISQPVKTSTVIHDPVQVKQAETVIDPLERLEKLAKLRDGGIISEEEFQQQKSRLLSTQSPAKANSVQMATTAVKKIVSSELKGQGAGKEDSQAAFEHSPPQQNDQAGQDDLLQDENESDEVDGADWDDDDDE